MRTNLLYIGMTTLLIGCTTELPDPTPSGPMVLETPSYFGPFAVPTDNPQTYEGVALGRMLFYESQLSGDNTLSCGSCHQQEYAFADPRQFSVGISGVAGPFNAPALGNVLWENRLFWDGRSANLEEQALEPIQDEIELHQSLADAVDKLKADPAYPTAFEAAFGSPQITAERIGKALAQFERTLISANSPYDRYLREEYSPTDLELQGIELFFTHPEPSQGLRGANCGDCHLGPRTGGSAVGFEGFSNNGLDGTEDLKPGLAAVTNLPTDQGKFKVPGLRNVALTAPYMHDGRFATLEEVLDHYNEHVQDSETLDVLISDATNNDERNANGVQLGLTDAEKEALLAFLNMLTDEDFVTNPAFSDPTE